ncbi:MAG: hypothetical protein HC887_09865 [Desulfobacteraceae bacterium]|nr:hypothetical protein [Desulfobacteraceae bacterium]
MLYIKNNFKVFAEMVVFAFILSANAVFAYDNVWVHPYIVEEAAKNWPRDANHELYQNLGVAYRDTSVWSDMVFASEFNRWR